MSAAQPLEDSNTVPLASRLAEQNVLGSLLDVDGAEAWAKIASIKLAAGDFSVEEYGLTFGAIASLARLGKPHDVGAVAAQLGDRFDRNRLQILVRDNIATGTVAVYAQRVRDLAARRGRAAVEVPPAGFVDTDIANAHRFAGQHGADVRFTAEHGWMFWDGRRWASDDKSICVQAFAKQTALAIFDEVKDASDRNELFKHAKRSQSKQAIESMLWLARSEKGIPARLTDFDADPWLLNVGNGTLNLRTGSLQSHRREDLISNLVDIQFDAKAECPLWDAFLWRVIDKNDELYAYLRRFVGYLLVADTSDQSLHFLYGLGANGKSVFCEVIMRLLGEYAIAVSPDLIMMRRHGGIPNDIARLRGVRAAFMNETSQGSRFDESKLKDLTGGDTLTARFLHQEFFDFKPSHRIVIRGNHKPSINGTDEGIWRRLRLVPFTVAIPSDEQDRDLLHKLEEELPGILAWALAGCLEWQREGVKPPAIITEAVRAYREESDTLGRFISECCTVRKLAQVKTSVLFERYVQYCDTSGERWLASKDMPAEMERRGFTHKRSTGGQRLYLGLELTHAEGPWQPE